MNIDKVSVMNDKETEVMATYIEKAISYLKNCVVTSQTTHINLSDVDIDI